MSLKTSQTNDTRIYFIIGSGGVGKTTISSALGLYLATKGFKTCVITLDPSKRLKDTLKLNENNRGETRIDVEKQVKKFGLSQKNIQLYAGVLNFEEVFEEILRNMNHDETSPIFSSKFYSKLKESFSGVENYVAIEKINQLVNFSDYERIVLDTPPSFHTLNFLNYPVRVMNFVSTLKLKKAIKTFLGKRTGLRRIFSKFALWGLEKFLGKEFLHELLEFIELSIEIIFSFHENVTQIINLLKSEKVFTTLVLRPDEISMSEGKYILSEFKKNGFKIDAVLINRCHQNDDFSLGIKNEINELEVLVKNCENLINAPCHRREQFLEKVNQLISNFLSLQRREQKLIEDFKKFFPYLKIINEFNKDIKSIDDLFLFIRSGFDFAKIC